MTYTDWLRLTNALLAALSVLLFAIRLNDDWSSLSGGWKVVRIGLLGLIATVSFGSVELAFAKPEVPFGFRVVSITLSLAILIIGLWMVRREPAPSAVRRVDAARIKAILADVEGSHGPFDCKDPGCIAARAKLAILLGEAENPTR